MAWRIDEMVVRGEIDNRVRGQVTGRIWFEGRGEPLALELEGNPWRDLVGRRLVFRNPAPRAGELSDLVTAQVGVVGDITASRKVKVPEIPMEEIGAYCAAKKPWPWHWGNALYLEWFSLANGRVVIESAQYELTVEGDATWELAEDEEPILRADNAAAMERYLERLVDAAADDEGTIAPDEGDDSPRSWQEEPPMTEEEAEVWQARQDLLLDRVEARIEREGEEADYERILDEERERLRRELGEPEPAAEWETSDRDWDAMILAAEVDAAAAAGEEDDEVDPFAEQEAHPLVDRASDLFDWMREQAESEGWVPVDAQAEHPVRELLYAIRSIGPKLAGALNGGRWPPPLGLCALTIVRLKRAHGYIDDALRAAESCQEDNLVAPRYLGPAVIDLIDLAYDIKELIGELRERLGEAVDEEDRGEDDEA